MAMKRIHRDESGQVTAYFVAIMIVLFGLMAFAIDMGFFFHARRVAQNAADPGALAGAAYLPGCPLYGTSEDTAQDVALEFLTTNLEGKTFSTGDDILPPEIRQFTPPGGEVPYPSIYTLVERQQKYLLAQFLPGLRGAIVGVPGEAEAVCGPAEEGAVCPFYLPAPDPDADPVFGTDPDGDGPLTAPVISAYGISAGKVYAMKVGATGDQSPGNFQLLDLLQGTSGGNGTNDIRNFIASGCEEPEANIISEEEEVDTATGNRGVPTIDQALEGTGPVAPADSLYGIERTDTTLFPNGHVDCNLKFTLDDPTNPTTASVVDSTGTPLELDEVLDLVNEMTDPELMANSDPPCGGYEGDGTPVANLLHEAVQGRFMQIVLAQPGATGSDTVEAFGILRMYVVCWTNQLGVTAGNECVTGEPSGQVYLYGIFGDYSAPTATRTGGLGNNPLAPKHVVLVK